MKNKKTKSFSSLTIIEQRQIIKNEDNEKLSGQNIELLRKFLLEDVFGGPEINMDTLTIEEY